MDHDLAGDPTRLGNDRIIEMLRFRQQKPDMPRYQSEIPSSLPSKSGGSISRRLDMSRLLAILIAFPQISLVFV